MISSPEKARAFIDELAATSNVSKACEAADVSRQTAYRWRDGDIEFASAWDAALDADRSEPAADDEDEQHQVPAASRLVLAYPGAKYRLTEAAYLGDRLREADTIVEFDGVPGPHMIPVNEAARAAKSQVAGAAGAIDLAQLEVDDFVNEASVRIAALDTEISDIASKLLFAKGQHLAGTAEGRLQARSEVTTFQQQLAGKHAELAALQPMVEQAQETSEAAGRDARAKVLGTVREAVQPALTVRVAQATLIDGLALLVANHMRPMLSAGDEVWGRVRLNGTESLAASCVPDHNAVTKAFIGALLRAGGLSLDGISQLSNHGLETLRSYETVTEIVQRQNDSLLSRLQ